MSLAVCHAVCVSATLISVANLVMRCIESSLVVLVFVHRNNTVCKAVRTSAIQLQYNYNNITQKFSCIAAVRTSAVQLQYKFFLQLLQVACKFSASCRKLVLQRCIAGVRTSAIQLQYKNSCIAVVLQLYCTCVDCLTLCEWRSG